MNNLDLLDCIVHGTTPAAFLRTFKSVDDAVEHLANFYVENGGDSSEEEIEEAKTDAHRQLSIIYAMSLLGKKKSPRKSKASANNGRLGGRPKQKGNDAH